MGMSTGREFTGWTTGWQTPGLVLIPEHHSMGPAASTPIIDTNLGLSNRISGRALALPTANPGSFPGTPDGLPTPTRSYTSTNHPGILIIALCSLRRSFLGQKSPGQRALRFDRVLGEPSTDNRD